MKRAAAILLVFALAVVLGITPAGTEIRNQASASYIDSSGQPQTTTSNEVITIVKPVYDFTIVPDGIESDPGQTQSAVPGGRVYFPYTVTNNGNITDTINLTVDQSEKDDFDLNDPKIYLDENCNGQVDPAEAQVTSVKLTMSGTKDSTACVIVEATIPSDAKQNEKGLINIGGVSTGDPNVDPDGNGRAGDDNNWAQALATEKAALTLYKSAAPSGDVRPGDEITYSIEGQNVGGSAAYAVKQVVTVDGSAKDGILIVDEIPKYTTFVSVLEDETRSGAGNAQIIYKTSEGWTSTPPGNGVIAVGLLIEGSGAFFPQGAQYKLVFKVKVDRGVTPEDVISNSAIIRYDRNGDGDASDEGEEVHSNEVTNGVAPVFNVLNGPHGDPDSDGVGFIDEFTDPSGKTWKYQEITDTTEPRNEDAERITGPVYGGDIVYFPFTLQNSGNTEDTFDLKVRIIDPDESDDADPTEWICQILASDGTTPISGSVGPIPSRETFDYVVKCAIPAHYVESGKKDAAHIEVVATSNGDPTKNNKVTGIVADVLSGYAVDIAQHGNSGDGDPSNDNPPAHSANPGESVPIPFDVTNTGHNPDTYDLAAELPEGWSVEIYPDENCNGDYKDDSRTPVTDTGLMKPGETKCFILVVSVPENQSPVDLDGQPGTKDDNIKVTATSNEDSTKSDSISTDIEVNPVAAIEFTPDRSGTVTTPGTIVYEHTLTNTGNEPADVKFSLATGKEHWTYQIRVDRNGDGDFGDEDEDWKVLTLDHSTGILIEDLPATASRKVEIRVVVPDGEPIGVVDVAKVVAEATFASGGVAHDSVIDTTTVVGGDLRIIKSAKTFKGPECNVVRSEDGSEAKPGDCIVYTIVASNIGTGDLSKVIISDPLPSYTDYLSVSATASGFVNNIVLYSTDGKNWSTSPPADLAAGRSIYIAVDSNANGKVDDADLMPPEAKIVIIFKVRVQ